MFEDSVLVIRGSDLKLTIDEGIRTLLKVTLLSKYMQIKNVSRFYLKSEIIQEPSAVMSIRKTFAICERIFI